MNPFYKILIADNNDNLGFYTTDFTYQDSVKEDNQLKFTIQSIPTNISNQLGIGVELSFQFGYFGGFVSELRKARITDINQSYGNVVSFTVVALDLGNVMKKNSGKKIWVEQTASQIVIEIAEKYGLNTENIESTSYVYTSLPQGNRSDFELVSYLAEREKDGSFRFYVKNNVMYFGRLDLEEEASFRFEYLRDVISFTPSLEDSDKGSIASGVDLSLYDPVSKQTITSNNNTENTPDQTKMGEFQKGATNNTLSSNNGKLDNTKVPKKLTDNDGIVFYNANGDIIK